LAARGRWHAGDRRGALRLLRRSLAAGEALGARPEIARTCEELGRRLLELDAGVKPSSGAREAGDLLLRAQTLHRELGLATDLARLESLTRSVDWA
jgi:hypothetical protein